MTETTTAVQVFFEINTDQAPMIEELAWAHNCLCITHQPPDLDAWPAETHLLPAKNISLSCVTFQEQEDAARFQQALLEHYNIRADLALEDILPWMEYHRPFSEPFCIGQLKIIPSPPPLDGAREAMTLYLPAGAGFGTGRHETTASCLELMQHIDLRGKNIIDFGCGSGILALAALTLGASHVWLHDHDKQALSAAENHLKNHDLTLKSTVCSATEELPQTNLLLANILFEILCQLEEQFYNLVTPHALGIFSGVLQEQREDFLEKFHRWELVSEIEQGQWCSFVLRKL